MKKQLRIVVAVAAAIAIFFSLCKKPESPLAPESQLKLRSPSGGKIAKSSNELSEKATQILKSMLGVTQEFVLTGVEYLQVPRGYAATVWYKLEDGGVGNFVLISGNKVLSTGKGGVLYEGSSRQIVLVCTGTCQCSAWLQYNQSTQTISYNCGCPACTGNIYIVQ